MQVQCKVKNAMHDDKQMFLDFFENKRNAKSKRMILRTLESASTPKQHSSKALR